MFHSRIIRKVFKNTRPLRWRNDTKERILVHIYIFMNSVKMVNTDLIDYDVDILILQRLERDESTVNKCEYTTAHTYVQNSLFQGWYK